MVNLRTEISGAWALASGGRDSCRQIPHPAVFKGISVIIPTYNRIEKLLKVLGSLETQDLDKALFEVIVVDDGSTDSTESDLRTFMGKTALNIRYLKQANKKQGAARNLGLRHAKMPLIAFIGDDIVPSRYFLTEHLNFHQKSNRDGKKQPDRIYNMARGDPNNPFHEIYQ